MDKLDKLGITYLLQSEEKTLDYTRSLFSGLTEQYPIMVDVLFKLPYYTGELDTIETPMGIFQSHCYRCYLQAPYTFWSVYSLWEKGYYLESFILFRNLLEMFIQLRYFQKYPEKTQGHMNQALPENKKHRIAFITMFNEFAPGFYKDVYGPVLSGFAHGTTPGLIFRVESSSNLTVVMGNVFDDYKATFALNHILVLLFGYLNLFEFFFPKNALSKESLPALDASKTWLEHSMASHQKVNPNANSFYEHFNKIIYPNTSNDVTATTLPGGR